jgi:hypothetical protein
MSKNILGITLLLTYSTFSDVLYSLGFGVSRKI